MNWVRLAVLAACLPMVAAGASPAAPPPAAAGDAAVTPAIRRALAFLYRSASDRANFRAHGDDFVWAFYSIARTSRDPQLAGAALEMARERARAWRREHRVIPAGADAEQITDLVAGAFVADQLGARDDGFKERLRRAARRFTVDDFLDFDPRKEPPADGWVCDPCPKPLTRRSRYDVFTDALINTYFGDAYGIRLGASHRDVIRWLPRMRPYPTSKPEFIDAFYAVSHVVYTLNGYGVKRIAPRLLPDEVAFLRRGLAAGIEEHDPEIVGEALDTLKAFGFDEREPLIARGVAYLLSSQRSDGTWSGAPDDVYTRYHSAWTGIDGLRSYRFGTEIQRL
jgi:hypothetical protein